MRRDAFLQFIFLTSTFPKNVVDGPIRGAVSQNLESTAGKRSSVLRKNGIVRRKITRPVSPF